MRARGILSGVVAVLCAAGPGAALASANRSLHTSPGPRPGPEILYAPPALAPQLTNTRPWHAQSILVSGAEAYHDGEFLYQDYLYDDHGAHELPDPTDPRAISEGDLFSKPNGTYTYPTGPGYDNNAADLVEFRVKPLRRSTAFRFTLNTLLRPIRAAFTIAIGGESAKSYALPDGANVNAPGRFFLTVRPTSGGDGMVAGLVNAATGRRVTGPAPVVHVDFDRRQIQVEVSHQDWNPRRHTVRLAAGVGLWDSSAGRYLLPGAVASATVPGGAGVAAHPAAFFNVAFRTHEPLPSVAAGPQAVLNASWWRDYGQGQALAKNTIAPFYANVSFAKLARHARDNSMIPTSGPIDRILASHFQIAQGANYSKECGFGGAVNPASCVPEYTGQLQPYAVYIPSGTTPIGGFGMTLLLHSLSANYNQFLGSRNQSQFALRATPSIVITPEARGPDQFYEGYSEADTFEVWADIARRYRLNPEYTNIAGYSMGGIGTFKLAAQFPDLFARAQPTVGDEANDDVLASLRNVPVLMWNNVADELVNAADYGPNAAELSRLGYRFQLDAFQPCANPRCSPLFPDHLELAVNDQFAPAAAFLGSAHVNPNPAHVTYVYDTERDRPALGIVANHAYWISGLTLRSSSHKGTNGDPDGKIDAVSHGFGVGDPSAPLLPTPGVGTLTGGNLGPLHYVSTTKAWGPVPGALRSDTIDITATNIATASIDVGRAAVDCGVKLVISTDGPLTVTLPGCGRVVHAG